MNLTTYFRYIYTINLVLMFKTTSAVSKLGQLRSPHFACLSEETGEEVGPFYLVSMPGEVKYSTQGNGKNLLCTHGAGDLILYTTIGVNIPTNGSCQIYKREIER